MSRIEWVNCPKCFSRMWRDTGGNLHCDNCDAPVTVPPMVYQDVALQSAQEIESWLRDLVKETLGFLKAKYTSIHVTPMKILVTFQDGTKSTWWIGSSATRQHIIGAIVDTFMTAQNDSE